MEGSGDDVGGSAPVRGLDDQGIVAVVARQLRLREHLPGPTAHLSQE